MTLQEMLDKAEITNQMASYCRSVDRLDRELLLSVLHPDALIEITDTFRGAVPEFVDFVWQLHGGMLAHSHQTSSSTIRLWGDKAASEFYFTASLWYTDEADGGTKEILVRGRYVDRWTRNGESWLIIQRWIAMDMREIRDVSPNRDLSGRRDRQDRSYEFLAGPD